MYMEYQLFQPLSCVKKKEVMFVCGKGEGMGLNYKPTRQGFGILVTCKFIRGTSIYIVSVYPHIMHHPIDIQMETPTHNNVYPTSGTEMNNRYVFPS
jgi:hypothetical protein